MPHRRRDGAQMRRFARCTWLLSSASCSQLRWSGLLHKIPDVIYVSGNPNPSKTFRVRLEACMSTTVEPLPHLRFEIPEAARILRISRATLYERIREGLITTQKDGRRTFITAAELQRYVIPGS
jgi:excisionase family DNA binding protein